MSVVRLCLLYMSWAVADGRNNRLWTVAMTRALTEALAHTVTKTVWEGGLPEYWLWAETHSSVTGAWSMKIWAVLVGRGTGLAWRAMKVVA